MILKTLLNIMRLSLWDDPVSYKTSSTLSCCPVPRLIPSYSIKCDLLSITFEFTFKNHLRFEVRLNDLLCFIILIFKNLHPPSPNPIRYTKPSRNTVQIFLISITIFIKTIFFFDKRFLLKA